ncbi:hypothetical protein GV67_13995 [Pseudorhizobium pelagicum]|uniref:Uncharacterized protein n=1 Tax=Pseudorhizobium pelagicum TaxID=1509405 RepID=A0A922T811_9HYPH|nr:hypothetical protein GV68_23525 [Pseudorhizobium pelagicum]KEQ03235.1 hypothetical protein GV67_13995 [Pseudorhizobium pelagicum]
MPGLNDSFFFLAFVDDGSGQIVPASQPTQAPSEVDAIRFAKELEPTSIGVVAWSRRAEPAIGEIGPPVVIYTAGKVGDFD